MKQNQSAKNIIETALTKAACIIIYGSQANETMSNALSLWAGFPGEGVDVAKSIDIKQQNQFFYLQI